MNISLNQRFLGGNVNVDLASLRAEIDKLDIGKLETAPVSLSKLSYVVKNEVIKKTEYNELVIKN